MLRWTLAAIHLLALGIGLGAIAVRSRALRGAPDLSAVRRALAADTWWGIAAGLWLSTGLWRWLGGIEKGTTYYVQNQLFLTKMALFLLILALEIAPMVTLIRWRTALKRGEAPDTRSAGRLATLSTVQVVIIVLMVIAATGMARGFGAGN